VQRFEVNWSIIVDAMHERDAAAQAWIILDNAINGDGEATIVFVTNQTTGERQFLDMKKNLRRMWKDFIGRKIDA